MTLSNTRRFQFKMNLRPDDSDISDELYITVPIHSNLQMWLYIMCNGRDNYNVIVS